jgi:hypothetical protein
VGTIWAQTGAIQENCIFCYSAGKRRCEALTSGRAEGSNPSATATVTVEKSQVKSYFGACCELSRAPHSHEVRR